MIYVSEKSLKDVGDKAPKELKEEIEKLVKELKDVKDKESKEVIEEKTKNLSDSLQKIGQYMYQNRGLKHHLGRRNLRILPRRKPQERKKMSKKERLLNNRYGLLRTVRNFQRSI